jgi:hypothetical protein
VKKTVGLVGMLFVHGCSRNPQPSAIVPPLTFAFSAQTSPDTLLEGLFEGTATIRDGWITVEVKPTLTFPPGPQERWRSVTIRSFVATDYRPGIWKTIAVSPPVNVWRFLDFGRGPATPARRSMVIPEMMHFQVPIPKGANLETSRLGFELEWVTLYRDYGQTEQNYAFSGPLAAAPPPSP